MRVRRVSAVEEEFITSLAFCLGERPQAATRFNDEVAQGVKEISSEPNTYPFYEDKLRRKVLSVFPFSIYYIVDPDEIVIIAIMHNKRRPEYWRNRL